MAPVVNLADFCIWLRALPAAGRTVGRFVYYGPHGAMNSMSALGPFQK
jgi:hypothetical protein